MTAKDRLLAQGLSLVIATGAVSACTGPSDTDQARRATEALAHGLEQGRLDTNAVAPGTPKQAATQVAGVVRAMGSRPKVTVDTPRVSGDGKGTATAHITWTIRTGAPAWSYTAELPLAKSGDEWRVTWTPANLVPGLTTTDRVRLTPTAPDRADILGAGGKAIVTERPVTRFGIDRSRVAPQVASTSANRLSRAVGIDPAAYTKQVAAAGPQAYVEAIVLRKGVKAPDGDGTDPRTIPGVLAIDEKRPLAPTSGFASGILGRVGPATADVVKASKGAVLADDKVGLNGLQATYDQRLRGTLGYRIEKVAQDGTVTPLTSAPTKPGKPITLTLDERVQTVAEHALAQVKPASAVVVLRPSTGDVLAAASGPGSDGAPTATLGRYAPGSTFKIVTALALLRAGLTVTSPTTCPPTLTVAGRTFKNYDDYPKDKLGAVPLRTAFAQSCNTALMGQRGKATQQGLADAADALGLTASPALGVPAELGTVPTDAKDDAEHAVSMIGQGKVTATPLGMATVAASVAAGRAVRPRLLADPKTPGTETTDAAQHPLTPAQAESLRTLMRAVTTEGSGTVLQDVPGAPVLSKTGTAEYGTQTPPKTHAWMVAAQGDVAVAVFVADGKGGAHTAGPILKAVLTDIGRAPR